MQLNDKLIMITGGGQGLGQAMALRLAKQGARLALVDVNQEALDATCAQVAELGSSARAICATSPKNQTSNKPLPASSTAGHDFGIGEQCRDHSRWIAYQSKRRASH